MPPKIDDIAGPGELSAPPQVQARYRQALSLHQAGQLERAQAIYEEVLAADPAHVEALHLLGVAACQTGRYQRAVALIGKAIALRPNVAAYYSNRGIALKELKRLDAAVASQDKAIGIRPDYADAHSNRGNALLELGRIDAAVASYDDAIALRPIFGAAHYNRGLALLERKQAAAALGAFDKAAAICPDHADAYASRGLALMALGRPEAAIGSIDRAIRIQPEHGEAYGNRGNALKDCGQLEAALASYKRAIAIAPGNATAYSNLGVAQKELMQLGAALASYAKAIAIAPDFAEAHWNKSLVLLMRGDFANGWKSYEWRWQTDSFPSPRRNFTQPLWLGAQPLRGKTILLHGEQGLGDALQFCRYARLAAALGARVVLEVDAALVRLLRSLEGVAELVAKGNALPAFDCHCPLLSLPLAFRTSLATIPCAQKYLSSDAANLADWAARLGARTRLRVGIAWSGSQAHPNDRNRSLRLADFMAHLPQQFEYVSLQKEVRELDRDTLQTYAELRHFGAALEDFADTAALCELVDVVICIDTGVAHLSGALGRPTWILLPWRPDWRWLLDRDDSPWYASVKLYRQDAPGAWTEVLARVAADLAQLGGVD